MTTTHPPDPPIVLSERQQRILTFLRTWMRQHGYAPSLREIAKAVGLASPSSVTYQLETLERHGLIRRTSKTPRALDVTER